MLSQKHRLRRNADILAVLRTGKQVRLKGLKVFLKQVPPAQPSRVACVVGKSVSSLATQRHRYQRWLRVLAREYVTGRPNGVDVVLVALPEIRTYPKLDSLRRVVSSSVSF